MLKEWMHLLARRPRAYEWIQRLGGSERIGGWLRSQIDLGSLLPAADLGGGTGFFRGLLSSGHGYICLDLDPEKLSGFRLRFPGEKALCADAARTGLRDRSVRTVCCINMSHHLDDAALDSVLREARRICSEGIFFVDAIRSPGRTISNILWRYDRGAHPRSEADLRRNLERHFRCHHVNTFSYLHRYLLWAGTPRDAAGS